MLDNLLDELSLIEPKSLYQKGLKDGSIIPFSDELYEKMSHKYFNSIPISLNLKYLSPKYNLGKCYDISLIMFLCFDNSLLVCGEEKNLKSSKEHEWIEMDDYCYDPILLLRFKKDIFYDIFKPFNLTKTTIEQFKNASYYNKKIYEEIKTTDLSDYQPNGKKRIDLCVTVPIVREIAKIENNENFMKELNEYLKLINYDEEKIYTEMQEAIQKLILK
jgi:hypothetical protein